MPQRIQRKCGAARVRSIRSAWALSMPRWNETAASPQRAPLRMVSPSSRWRSVGVTRRRSECSVSWKNLEFGRTGRDSLLR